MTNCVYVLQVKAKTIISVIYGLGNNKRLSTEVAAVHVHDLKQKEADKCDRY